MFLNDMSTIVRLSNVFMNRSLTGENLTYAENYILMYLNKKEKVSQDDIASYFSVDKGSISKSISSLTRKNYIKKALNPNNKRENLIQLSELGKMVFSKNKILLDEWHKKIMEGITKEEVKLIGEVLLKMADNAKKAIYIND